MALQLQFLSGWATTTEIWDAVIQSLTVDAEITRTDWWTALESPLETDKKESVLIGWSLGGLLALKQAAAEPAGLRGLVLISSMARLLEDDGASGVKPAAARAMKTRLKKNRPDCLRNFFTACIASPNVSAHVERLCRCAEIIRTIDLHKGLEFMFQTDLRDLLPSLKMPILILHGDSDAIVPFGCGEDLSLWLPQSEFVRFKGMGHALPVNAPEKIAEQIDRFISAGHDRNGTHA